jgi:hypothetical protein
MKEINTMKKTHVVLATLASAGLTFAVAGLANAAAPAGEEWEYTMTVEMGGMKMPLPSSKVCTRPGEGNTPPVEKNCKVKEHKVSGATTSFVIVCGPPEPGEMRGRFTRKGDRVEGRYTMTQGGDAMTVTADGRKLGACDPSKTLPPRAGK